MSKNILDRISVANPCEMAWEEMQGDAQKRYCGYCDKHVYNLSQMSRREAENLLRATNGKLCARFERNADGRIHTMDEPIALPRFNQKFLRLAATTMSAALSLSPTVIAKPVRNLPVLNLTQEQKEKSEPQEKEKTGKIYGTVFDGAEAGVPYTKIVLLNKTTSKEYKTLASVNGMYEFVLFEAGTYEISFESDGFKKLTQQNIEISIGQSIQRNVTLVVGQELLGVVSIAPEYREPMIERPAENMSLQLRNKSGDTNTRKNLIRILLSPFKKKERTPKN